MNIAILLMGGSGYRFDSPIPKQYVKINDKELFLYTLENFINCNIFDKIVLVDNENYIENTRNILSQKEYKNVNITIGGFDRNQSIINGIKFCEKEFQLDNNDIIVTHDAARIFTCKEIINEHINELIRDKNIVLNTAIKNVDTLSYWDNKLEYFIDREKVLSHQTPQSLSYFTITKIINHIEEQDISSTDIISVAHSLNMKIKNIKGSPLNFKVTEKDDLKIVEAIIKNATN